MSRTRLRSILGALVILVGAAGSTARANPLLVIDAASGTVIRADDAGVPWYPASLTKLMTGYLVFHAIRDGHLALDTKITVSANARAQPPSKIGLPVGAEITVGKALEALIVRSANDIAVVLAEAVGGSEERFVKLMNAWSRRLGMSGSYFANPHGLPDPRQVTTARDMGLLATAIIKQFPEHAGLFTMQDFQIGKSRLRARNSLLRDWAEADGMKTGFICASGYNLVASATREGRRLVAVVLGATSGAVRSQVAKQMLMDGFSNGTSSGRSVTDYTNGGFFQRMPTDMKPVVCKQAAPVRVAKPGWVRGWAADFGRFASAESADSALTDTMLALRNVIYAGRGQVVADYRTGKVAAVMSSLDADQARQVCAHLTSKSIACRAAEPKYFLPPDKADVDEEETDDVAAPAKARAKPAARPKTTKKPAAAGKKKSAAK